MDVAKLLKKPDATVNHTVVIEKIGRISIDGEVNGKPVAVVFWLSEVPATVKTTADMHEYMLGRLIAKAKQS